MCPYWACFELGTSRHVTEPRVGTILRLSLSVFVVSLLMKVTVSARAYLVPLLQQRLPVGLFSRGVTD